MGTPRDKDARRFYLAGGRRKDDGRNLARFDQSYRGAAYLAGYAIECMLKALIIVQSGRRKHEVIAEFRGSKAHNFDHLRFLYFSYGGAKLPMKVTEAFVLVKSQGWSPDWRYEPAFLPFEELEAFLDAVDRIYNWADQRM